MGSRAVVIVARNGDAAEDRFGITNQAAGVIVTRTGRPFFADGDMTKELLDRVRAGLDYCGMWEKLGTDWFILDAEILPWSAKAVDLLKTQYAATGVAATTMLAASSSLLNQARRRVVDGADGLADLAARTDGRLAHTQRYVEAYRRYCWPTDGLNGIKIAPFQLLAAEGEVLARRPHRWHLNIIDQLVENDPELFHRTDRRFVDTGNDASIAEATSWWLESTKGGGEGMVVKPADTVIQNNIRNGSRGDTPNVTARRARETVLPGVKCRGREYLRIIYGPEYLEPANLERLRDRSLGHKQSLARREYALGIEALDRFVARQHLFRTHQCVFAVLALESEPVDPRL